MKMEMDMDNIKVIRHSVFNPSFALFKRIIPPPPYNCSATSDRSLKLQVHRPPSSFPSKLGDRVVDSIIEDLFGPRIVFNQSDNTSFKVLFKRWSLKELKTKDNDPVNNIKHE